MSRSSLIPHPLYLPGNIDFRTIGRNRQIYLSALKGLTDLVFHPPMPETDTGSKFRTTLGTDYPETVYLDQARLRSFSKDVSDIVVSYMFLLLFRQLLYSSEWSSISSRPPLSKLDDAMLLKIKNEILAINSARLGHVLHGPPEQGTPDGNKWAGIQDSIILHIAKRAEEARNNLPSSSTPTTTPPTSPTVTLPADSSYSSSSSPSPVSSHSIPSFPFGSPPDSRIVNVARRWVLENIHMASPLYSVIYDRLHEVVFTGVVAQAYPGRQYTTGQLFSSAIESYAPLRQGGQSHTVPLMSGMEPLADEIRILTDKISRAAIIHLNVYLPIYELSGFLEI